MKSKQIHIASLLLLMIGIVVLAGFVKSLMGRVEIARGAMTSSPIAQSEPAAVTAGSPSGDFSGQVKLSGVATGLYSETLTVPTGQPDLGSVDLALHLVQSSNLITGYVSLDKTLIFSVEHTLAGQPPLKVGPYLSGSFDGTTLTLQSEQVGLVVSGQPIRRQFRLIGTLSADGATLTGEYRETLWGYTRQPITTIGTLTLNRPIYGGGAPLSPTPIPTLIPPIAGSQSLYLPIAQR